jgi:competence protein ComEA
MKVSMAVLIPLLLIPLALGEETPRIDLNTATLSELDNLPGIGPVIAERILELREKSGPFKRIEDLMNIRGIGEKKFLKLKDLITVKSKQQSDEISQNPEVQKSGS